MPLEKVINKNKPFRCSDNPNFCEGQYNYENGILTGVEDYKELYSVMHSEDNSPKILESPGYIYGLGKMRITNINITESSGDDHVGDDIRVYILDDATNNDIADASDYSDVRNVGGDIEAYRWFRTRNTDGCTCGEDQQEGDIGDITIDDCADWEDSGTNWKCQCGTDSEQSGPVAGYSECWELDQFPYVINTKGSQISAGWNSIIDGDAFSNHPDSPIGYDIGGNYYIVVWTAGKECNCDLGGPYTRSRRSVMKKYIIPKSDVYNAWSTGKNICFRSDPDNSSCTNSPDDEDLLITVDINEPGHIEGPEGQYSGHSWSISDLVVEFDAPVSGYNPYTDYYYPTTINFLNLEEPEYWNLRPDNDIVYHREYDPLDGISNLEPNHIFDFRPIPFVETVQDNFDLQSFYTEPDYSKTTAPIEISLSFRIAENRDLWFPEYLGYDESTNPDVYTNLSAGINDWRNQKFMFTVVDWETDNLEMDWNDIEFPTNYQDMLYRQDNYGTFQYMDLTNSSGLYATDNDEYQKLTKIYSSSGVKIIKALIFSYKNADFNNMFIQPLRWKLVTIKIYLGLDAIFIENFGDIIGGNFNYIPWPYTPVIIGGISEQSQYINSLDTIKRENKFSELELDEETKFKNSLDNSILGNKDEMGRHLGKVDIQQVRFFESSYDMTDLLMLDSIDDYDTFVRYDDWQYWFDVGEYSDNPKWPTDSCVGLIFISDSVDQELINKCNIEINLGDMSSNKYNDTSMNGNKGYVIGDFSVRKPNVGEPTRRETDLEIFNINSEERAI
tara:strand:+ start:415 stop:2769 length:2355 start_codon:yes stop_codon:yes gene_type:complete